MSRRQEPTCVSLVDDVLINSDDFKTVVQLQEETRCPTTRVTSALYHLYDHKAVDMLVSKGKTYWYATPETDTRLKILAGRKIEDKPRRIRRKVISPKI